MNRYILGIKVDLTTFDKALATVSKFITEPRFHLVTTVNAEFILTAQEDSEFKEILNSADLSLPDGVGVLMAQKYLTDAVSVPKDLLRPLKLFLLGLKVGFFTNLLSRSAEHGCRGTACCALTTIGERVAGVDFTEALIETASEEGWTVGLLGGESFQNQNVCDLAKNTLLIKYPGLKVVYCSREPSEAVSTTSIDLLFVAFGHPKQEKWLWENRDRLVNVKIGIGVGATFDFLVGKQRRAPRLLRQLKLEWLWRLLVEPARFKRIFNAYPIFPLRIFWSSL